jgi:hypothetical protein
VRLELGWEASVDIAGKFSAVLSGFANVIFSLLDQEWWAIQEIEAATAGIRWSDFASRVLNRP